MSTILIISPVNDSHSLAVKREIANIAPDVSVAIFDSGRFPASSFISISDEGWELRAQDISPIRSSDVRAVWWRRPSRHRIDCRVHDSGAQRFAENECIHAFDTIVYWSSSYLVVNPVEKEIVANRKTVQLRIARRVGLRIPKTLVTNSPEEAVAFSRQFKNRTIFKTLTPPISTFGETRRFDDFSTDLIETIRLAPIILQEEIAKARDIRVTVIGKEVFATWIEVRNPAGLQYPDWRLDVTARAHRIELPGQLVDGLLALMETLGLAYGAIDLVEDEMGNYYFLEVNPSGQFLFNEVDTGEPMSAAFARLLLQPHPDGRDAAEVSGSSSPL